MLAVGLGSQSWSEILIRLVVIVGIATIGLAFLRRGVTTAIRRGLVAEPAELKKRIDTLSDVVFRTVLAVMLLITGLTILSNAGFNITPILAGAGVVGLAVGLGAQSLIRDTLNGIFILLENQFARGDVITAGGVSGYVEDVNLRRTLVRDQDGTLHNVPNGAITIASNHTKRWARVHLNIAFAITEDARRAIELIDTVGAELAADEKYASMVVTPPRALWVESLGEGAMKIKVLGDTRPGAQWEVAGEFRRRLQEACRQQQIVLV
jgi:moderate conductance mechanosensitive channel